MNFRIRIHVNEFAALWALAAYCILLTPGCMHTGNPTVALQNIAVLDPVLYETPGPRWEMGNLKPDEDTVLERGGRNPFSIDLALSGTGQYILTCSSGNKDLRPFIITTMQDQGSVDFSGTITWFPRVSRDFTTVTMQLYCIETSESGKTKTKTLVKKIARTYHASRDSTTRCGLLPLLRCILGLDRL